MRRQAFFRARAALGGKTPNAGAVCWRGRLHTGDSGHGILDAGIALVRGDPGAQDLHGSAAAGAGQRRSWTQEGGDRHGEPGLREPREELRAKDLGQGLVAEQVAFAPGTGLGAPLAVLGIDGRRGHGEVHMRMVVEAPGVGVEHGDRPGGALQPGIVAAEGVEGLPTALQQEAYLSGEIHSSAALPRIG